MFLLVKSNPTACNLHKCHTIADAAARLGENISLIRVSFSSLSFFSKVIQLLFKPKNQYNLFTKNPFITKKYAQLFQDEVLSFLAHRTYLFPHPPFFPSLRLTAWRLESTRPLESKNGTLFNDRDKTMKVRFVQ